MSGAPLITGTFNFTVTATDANGCTGSRNYSIIINNCPVITVNPASLPGGLVGASYSQTVSATGGATPYTFNVSAGSLPPGLTLASNGALTGTPTTAGAFNFTVKATDTNGCTGTRAYTVLICPTITVNPASLPNGFTSIPYSQTLTATGSAAPYSFAVTTGALPGGLILSASGSLTGTPTGPGTFNFTVTATDAMGCTGERSFSVVISDCPAIALTPASLPNGFTSIPYSQTLTATGGAAPYTFAVITGSLPGGLILSGGGSLTGAPAGAGTFNFTVRATDANGCAGSQSYSVVVSGCPALTVSPASLPNGLSGASYSQTITATGGAAPYSFSVSAGTLTPGLSLGADGALTGTPTATGASNFTVKVTDANGCIGTRAYTLRICATLTVTPAALPSGFANAPYDQTLTASGGAAPYTFAVSSGALPPGVTLSSGGALSGASTSAGEFNFTVTATDANGCTGSRNYTIVLNNCPTITVSPASLPGGLVSVSYSQTVTATGSTAPYSFSVSAGTLPPGLSLASGGALTGTPTAAGSFNFTVKATDVSGCMGTRAYTLLICPTITVTPTLLPDGFSGVAYSQTLTASGGAAPHSFAVTAGSLPPGITLSGGVLSGAPTGFGTFNFTVTATDANGCAGSRSYSLLISNCSAITVNPASLPNSSVGASYSQTVSATGGAAPYTFSVSAGTLPPGLTLASGGALTGTPTTAGSFTFTVMATDANGCMGTRGYTLVICPTIAISPASLPSGLAGVAYSQTLTASGGTAPHTFAVTSGALPAGVTLSSSGVLTGTPTSSGSFSFTVTATDAGGCTGSRSYTLSVSGGLQYYALPAPVRLLDTRPGFSACVAPAVPLGDNAIRLQQATGACTGVPANAKAIVGNATVVNSGPTLSTGFHWITLYPSDAALPDASNLNFADDQIVPNNFTVGLGADGAFNIYSHGATHFIVDITGYYAPPGAGGLYYHPLPAPVRLFDTRPGFGACDAPGAPLVTDGVRSVTAHGPCSGATIPSTAKAIVGNATVVNSGPTLSTGFHWITLYPFGVSRPDASNLNYREDQIIPNAFVTGLSADGKFNIYSHGATHFIVDVAGYFSDEAVDANGVGLLYNPLPAPVRLLDTRPGFNACDAPATPLGSNAIRAETATVACSGIPSGAKAVVGNATVVNVPPLSTGFHWITLYPFGAPLPDASNLNYRESQIVPNAFVVGLSADGKLNIFSHGATHFIIDLTGYFAP
jgi:hypothetical protein